jgi:prephenate dehydratase
MSAMSSSGNGRRPADGPRIGFQGESGAAGEQALLAFMPEAQAVPYPSLSDLFMALSHGEIAHAFVPVENSHAGSVVEAYELMLAHTVTVSAEWAHSSPPDDQVTRYFLLAAGGWSTSRTSHSGSDKTSVVFGVEHHPGSLGRALQCFTDARVNLTRLESRPSPQHPGEYMFFVDVQGSEDDSSIHQALEGLRQVTTQVRILGSYRAAD